ncbi:MAG: cyclic nucleotide-binding domain-containing protein [Terracidiphilus sp.]
MKLDSSAFVADRELIEALEKRCAPILCEEDRILFAQGELSTGLYILRAGRATLSMASPAGDTFMCIPVSAGSVLGLPALIGNQPYSLTAKALRGAELSFVSREDFSQVMLVEPSLSLSVLRVLAAEVRTARYALLEFCPAEDGHRECK